jgi:UDP-N-acetylmuramoylalanine--D-glutamate ligase
MDWHKDQSEYVRAKENIVRHQLSSDWAVINRDYETSLAFEKITKAKVKLFSKSDLNDEFIKANQLRGEHNLENISAALEVARILKINKSVIIQTLLKFKGLEHRLEFVRKVREISFFNDSFSTNPQTTIAAIKSFKEPITIILGGYDKKLDYREMIREIVNNKNVHTVILIGDIRYSLEKLLINTGYKGLVFDSGKKPMEDIVKLAYKNTKPGGVVLLSPATSSFDMFENYKIRGQEFKQTVKKL